jgi:peptidoglycan/xylan/chitin deacetylase (PgdA/CDA1 family)
MNLRAKTLITATIGFSGLMTVLERAKLSGRRIVLTLHRVLHGEEVKDCYNPYLALSVTSFDELLRFLRERLNVLTLDELLASAEKPGNGRKPICALTFDDGWEDNYRVAFPILKKYGLPATIFLATGYIGSSELMPEERLFRLWNRAEQQNRTHVLSRELSAAFETPISSGDKTLTDYHALSKTLPHTRKIAVLRELEQKYGAERQTRSQFLSWEQVHEMARDGVRFESHTVHHKLLAQETDSDILDEIGESRRTIAAHVGYVPDMLAYPSGNFDDRVARIVAESGYRAALTTIPGALNADCDPYRLPRIAIADDVLSDVHGDFSGHRLRFQLVRSVFQGHRA